MWIRFARTFFVRGQEACNAVATITDHYGPRLAEEFGGTTAFADEKSEDVPVPDSASTGQYL